MPRITRTMLAAILILVSFLSLPIWLPGAVAARQSPPDGPAAVDIPAGEPKEKSGAWIPEQPGSTLKLEDLPAMTLVDAGWVRGASTAQERIHPRAILRWQPLHSAPAWRVETGHVRGAFQDDQDRLYLAGQDSLTVLDQESGQAIRSYEIDSRDLGGPNAGHPIPIGRDADRLYLRNHATSENLFVFDLETGRLGENSYRVCEHGHPFESRYLSQERAVVTFCLDFSSGIQGYLTKLILVDGSRQSVQIPVLGPEEYMAGNGFAVSSNRLAYVVDSDARALVEIDLATMSILRQTNYQPMSKAGAGSRGFLSVLLDLAAAPAQAKRWMSFPAISPDGRFMAVDGGFITNDGANSTAWLIDLESLIPIRRLELPDSPIRFLFTSNTILYVLLQTEHAEGSQVLAHDIHNQRSAVLDLPTPGRVTHILP